MQQTLTPLHPIWYVKFLGVFIFGFIFSLCLFILEQRLENTFGMLLFSLLITFFYLTGKAFQLSFHSDSLHVQTLMRSTSILPSAIKKIYIRQGIFMRKLHIGHMLIHFENPEMLKRFQLHAFGKTFTDQRGYQFPGVFGDMISIPDISLQESEKVVSSLEALTGRRLEVEYLGVRYPYHREWSATGYYMQTAGLIIIALFFLFFAAIFLIVLFMHVVQTYFIPLITTSIQLQGVG